MDQLLGKGIHIIFQGLCCFTGGLKKAKGGLKNSVSALEVGMCPSDSIQLLLLEKCVL